MPTLDQRYRSPSDLPQRLPVFPLLGAILLPRATLPLVVYEPRYLHMLDDVIAGPRLLVIVQPDAGEVESPPGKSVGLRRVGCIGRVTKFEELDDGRLVIMLTGISRCKVTGEVPTDKPYRVCILDCEPYGRDFDKGAGEATVDRPALVKAMKAYLDVRTLAALRSTIAKTSTEELVNMVALAAPHGPEEKQAILEAADLKARADILVALAEMDHAAGAGGRGSTLQ